MTAKSCATDSSLLPGTWAAMMLSEMRFFADGRCGTALLLIFLVLAGRGTYAGTLTFIAQFDPYLGTTNRSWFSGDNWFEPGLDGGLVEAGRVPLAGEEAIITGAVDLGATGIRVRSLTLTNGASLTGGVVAVERVRMQGGSTFANATVNVLTSFDADGTGCTVNGGALTILSIGQGRINPAPQPGTSLVLTNGAVLAVSGTLAMSDSSRITATGPVPNRLNLFGLLTSTNSVSIEAAAGSKLILDHSGTIRSMSGTLLFEEGEIEWLSSSGVAFFDAARTNASIFFSSALQVPETCTTHFVGPGTNWIASAATVNGAIRIGLPGTDEAFSAGNLRIQASAGGTGDLRVQGNGTNGAALMWADGTLSIPIEVSAGAAMHIEQGTAKLLSSCIITNSGLCTLTGTTLGFEGGALFENLPGGRFEIHGASEFRGEPLPNGGALNNRGVFSKTGSGIVSFGSMSSAAAPAFNNLALVEITGGTLRLGAGLNRGDFRISPGATLAFWGAPYDLYEGTDFLGEGAVTIANEVRPARVRLLGRSTAFRLQLGANGVIAGPGPSVFPLAAVRTLLVSSNGTLADLSASAHAVELHERAVLTNVDLSISGALSVSGTEALLHRSTLKLEASAAGSIGQDNEPTAAMLRLEGASLLNSGTLRLGRESSVAGDMASVVRVFPGGRFSGAGLVDVPMENSGTIDPSGILTVAAGKPLKLETSGRLVIGLGETNSTLPHDQLRVLGNVELGGTLVLEFAEGFLPQSSQAFEVVRYGSVEGRFTRIESPSQRGIVWTSTYSPSALSIALQQQAEVGSVTLDQGQLMFPFPTVPGTVYLVQASSDLGTWETLQTVSGDGGVLVFAEAPSQPRRFYRVLVK